MDWDVRFGRFDRGDGQPIFVKEKKGEDGSISTRIYQRKDLESITNPIAKAIKAIKYSFEDLCYEKKAVGKFFQLLGFPKINDRKTLVDASFEDNVKAFQAIETDARLGYAANNESRTKLFHFLDIDAPSNNLTTIVNPEKYEDKKFLSDLQEYLSMIKSDKRIDLKVQAATALEDYFTSLIQNILLRNTLIADDKDIHAEYLKNRAIFKKTIIESSTINSGRKNALEAFSKKFDTVFPVQLEDLYDLSKSKNSALSKFDSGLRFAKRHNQSTASLEKAIKNMKRIFSTSPWVTKKQRLEAMQYFLDEQKTDPPLQVPYSLRQYFENTLKSQNNNSSQ